MTNNDLTKSPFEKVISDAIIANKTRNSLEGDDYLNDEECLMCGKCHTPKQVSIPNPICRLKKIPEEYIKVRCACKCEQEREKQIAHLKRVESLKRYAFEDREYEKMIFDFDDDPNSKASNISKNYVKKWEEMKKNNIGLMFYGSVGTGKTFYSACIANALLEKEVSVYMTNVPSLISSLSKNFGEDSDRVLQKVAAVSLLILDDVGIERDTEFSLEKFQEIVDTRYRSKKPTIISTNLALEQFSNNENLRYQRVYSRITEMSYPVEVTGYDRRLKIAAKKMQVIQECLF